MANCPADLGRRSCYCRSVRFPRVADDRDRENPLPSRILSGCIMRAWRMNRRTNRLFHDSGPASATRRRGRPKSNGSVT
jgi:hypothetical protein